MCVRVCVCVSVCVCVYACVRAYMRTCVVHMYVCVRSCMHECVHANVCVHVHVCMHAWVCVCAVDCRNIQICMCIYAHIHTLLFLVLSAISYYISEYLMKYTTKEFIHRKVQLDTYTLYTLNLNVTECLCYHCYYWHF